MSYQYEEEKTHRWRPREHSGGVYVKLHDCNRGEHGSVTLKYGVVKMGIANTDIPTVIDMLTAAYHTAMHG
jgi:hypothetical protein